MRIKHSRAKFIIRYSIYNSMTLNHFDYVRHSKTSKRAKFKIVSIEFITIMQFTKSNDLFVLLL